VSADNPWDTGGWTTAGDSGAADETVPDITALVPETGADPWANWGPTGEDLDFLGLTRLPEWAAGKFGELGVPIAIVEYAAFCAKGLKVNDYWKVLETLYGWLGGDSKVDVTDPCQILRTAKIGSCVARRYLQISFGPDLQDFWLDGKAADPANLREETFQFPPDERGIPTAVSYYPMDTAWFFGRVGTQVENWLVGAQQVSLWEGVRDRLREPAGTIFPKGDSGFGEQDISPLRAAVPLAPGPSTLHTTGVDWIYPKETTVVFKYAGQAVGPSGQEIVDEELFLIGGMTVTSEVEVEVKPGTLRVGEADVDGWTATAAAWRVRISDRWDYNPGDTQGIPLGPVDLEIPDDAFLLLQKQGCPPAPTPTDFNVISDDWHDVPLSLLGHPSLFVSLEPHAEGESGPFGGPPASFDFWDPQTGKGISAVDL
jgi:hypothetical protein